MVAISLQQQEVVFQYHGNRLATSCARLTKAVHDLVVVINLLRAADIRLVVEQLVVEQLVVSLLPSINIVNYKMMTTCSRLVNNWKQLVRAHLVDKL